MALCCEGFKLFLDSCLFLVEIGRTGAQFFDQIVCLTKQIFRLVNSLANFLPSLRICLFRTDMSWTFGRNKVFVILKTIIKNKASETRERPYT